MRFIDHCAHTCEVLGKDWPEVHRWLDELSHPPSMFGVDDFDPDHRRYRHTRQGVEQVRAWWGDEAAKAAELHICDDLCCKVEELPLDTSDFLERFGAY